LWVGSASSKSTLCGPGLRPTSITVSPAASTKCHGEIVDRDVNMSNPRRHRESALSEHRHHAKIFSPVLDEDATERQRFRKGRIDDEFGCRLILNGQERGRTTDILGALRRTLTGDKAADGNSGKAKEKAVHHDSLGEQFCKRLPKTGASQSYADALLALLKNASKSALI